jgi:hypothetical protein
MRIRKSGYILPRPIDVPDIIDRHHGLAHFEMKNTLHAIQAYYRYGLACSWCPAPSGDLQGVQGQEAKADEPLQPVKGFVKARSMSHRMRLAMTRLAI